MDRIITTLLFIVLTAGVASAEPWICYDRITKQVTKKAWGDGTKLGIAGDNNSNIIAGCILATKEEYDTASQGNMKVDDSLSIGDRVVDMTQVEVNTKQQAKEDAYEQSRLSIYSSKDDDIAKDRSNISLPKVDKAIDNIGDLNDAKVFLKKLARYIADSQ